jgi:hypothetical protein
MSIRLPSRRVLFLVLVIVALVTSSLAVVFRVEERKLAAQNQRLLDEIHDLQSRQVTPPDASRTKPSVLLNAPINEKTALSFYWFGDMDSHFRDPINFFVVSDADHRMHKVEMPDEDRQVNVFISAGEMKRIFDGLLALALPWADSRGREVFKDKFHRKGTDMLDITLVSSDTTAKTYIRIARMCDQLDRLDSVMPSPRILWQFRTFRVDNGCYIRDYDNSVISPE